MHALECQHHLWIFRGISIFRQFEDSAETVDPPPDGCAFMLQAEVINVSRQVLCLFIVDEWGLSVLVLQQKG